MGVDSVPHPSCVDEPLFSMLPIPYEVLYFFAIGRQEWARKKWAAPTPGEDEAGEEAKIETELTPIEEGNLTSSRSKDLRRHHPKQVNGHNGPV